MHLGTSGGLGLVCVEVPCLESKQVFVVRYQYVAFKNGNVYNFWTLDVVLIIMNYTCLFQGPLAQEFTAQEVRGLIRAIFQNTDRRAAILAKIKAV